MGINVLFLDIDGVLNSINCEALHQNVIHNDDIDHNVFRKDLVDNLRTIVHLFDLEIVITSTWRLDYTLPELRNIFNKQFSDKSHYKKFDIIDCTTKHFFNSDKNERAGQIKQWLFDKKYDVDNYFILDDESLHDSTFDDKFFKVDMNTGFDKNHLNNFINRFYNSNFDGKNLRYNNLIKIYDTTTILKDYLCLTKALITADNTALYRLQVGSTNGEHYYFYAYSQDIIAKKAFDIVNEQYGYVVNFAYDIDNKAYNVNNNVYRFNTLADMYIGLSEKIIEIANKTNLMKKDSEK